MTHERPPEPYEVKAHAPTFEAYLKTVYAETKWRKNWRLGQTYFNVLTWTRPDIAEKLRGSSLDCFQADALISPFLAEVEKLWDAE